MHGADPVPDHPDSVIFPADHGKATVFLGKEALLARLTDLRSARHQEVIDRFFELSRDQAFYYTNVYVLAEVFTSVRYGTSAREAAQLQADIEDSAIRVLHGSDDWSSTNLSNTPKEVFLAATQLYNPVVSNEFHRLLAGTWRKGKTNTVREFIINSYEPNINPGR